MKGVDTVRTSNDLASLASQVITHLGLLLRDKVLEQRRRVGRLEPDFYTEEDYRVSEDADLNPPVGGAEAPRIFEIIAGSGSPVVKTREVPVKRDQGSRGQPSILIPYDRGRGRHEQVQQARPG